MNCIELEIVFRYVFFQLTWLRFKFQICHEIFQNILEAILIIIFELLKKTLFVHNGITKQKSIHQIRKSA